MQSIYNLHTVVYIYIPTSPFVCIFYRLFQTKHNKTQFLGQAADISVVQHFLIFWIEWGRWPTAVTLHPKETQETKRCKTAPNLPKQHQSGARSLVAQFFVALLKVQSGRQTEAAVLSFCLKKTTILNYIKRQKLVEFHKTTFILHLSYIPWCLVACMWSFVVDAATTGSLMLSQ